MHCKLDPLVCLTIRPIIPLRHEMELRPASYTQVYRRKKLRGAYSEACRGGWRVYRCQPGRRGSTAKSIWATEGS